MSDRDPPGSGPPGHPKAEEVVSLFRRGLKFTEELLAENERLRYRVASLEAQVGAAEHHGDTLGADALIKALREQGELSAPAKRPKYSPLSSILLHLKGITRMRDWKEALRDCIRSHHRSLK